MTNSFAPAGRQAGAVPSGLLRRVRPTAALLWLFLAFVGYRYLAGYFGNVGHPVNLPYAAGWLAGFDQSNYFEAAKAYAGWDFTPDRHYYLPGYPLVAAPFIGLFGVHAFLPVGLISLLAVCYFFVRICDGLGLHRLLACALAWLALFFQPVVLTTYVVPWSSTPVAALQTVALFLFCRDGRARPDYLLLGLLGGLIPMFRPSDLLPLLPLYLILAGQGVLGAVRRDRTAPRLADVALTVAGGVAALALGVLAYVSVHGFALSPYLAGSRDIGYDFSELPLKFYLLFADPVSVYTAGEDHQVEAILHRLPWLMVGLCGLVTTLARRDRLSVLALCIALDLALYAAYVDLIPTGVWRFGNIHYFKSALPFLALFGWLFVAGLFRRRSRPLHGAVLVAAAGLTCLHLELEPVAVAGRQAVDTKGFDITLAAAETGV